MTSRRQRWVQCVVFLLWLALQAHVLNGCPPECTCQGTAVDCSHRKLARVPRNLPYGATRLDLRNNRLSALRSDDFVGLDRLRSLDLSGNELSVLGRRAFSQLHSLRTLHLDRNQISCLDRQSLQGLQYLETLTLNGNLLTSLPDGALGSLRNLLSVDLADNRLICDCHLTWLGRWYRTKGQGHAVCSSPLRLKDRRLSNVRDAEFKCSGLEHTPGGRCSPTSLCPPLCKCSDRVVDCRDRGLDAVPEALPQGTEELRLEQNKIREIPAAAFKHYSNLNKIDISNNQIKDVARDAFAGLTSLKSLILYNNKIEHLPNQLFSGLTSLQLLLLNANQIQCVGADTFRDLTGLKLLSLYDNKISNLPNNTFSSLLGIQTLHLGRNPFVCDCHLSWLVSFLRQRPVETSGVRCAEPRRMQRRRLVAVQTSQLQCPKEQATSAYQECLLKTVECPDKCACFGTTVDCSGRALKTIPDHIPSTTTELILRSNEISSIRVSRTLSSLRMLKRLDLGLNLIESIEDGAFDTLQSLEELILSENELTRIKVGTLRGLRSLRLLALNHNKISCLERDAFKHLNRLETFDLQSNPLACNCRLRWMAQWLRLKLKENLQVGSPTCELPDRLRRKPLTHLSEDDFTCPAGERDVDSCTATDYCPRGCTCVGTVVRCSKAKLTHVPGGISSRTTELYLDVNEIVSVTSSDLRHLRALKRLDLSNNHIAALENGTFAQLENLETLIISFNQLQCLESAALDGLRSLRVLSLHGNNLSRIPEGSFNSLTSITHIALGSNPLYCDCHLRWLAVWVKTDFREPGIARCDGPSRMSNKMVLAAKPDELICSGTVPDSVLAKCDVCFSAPCRNGGQCRSGRGRSFSCACRPGYYGDTCQETIDACYGNPCANGGTCKIVQEGRYSCHCPTGFTGAHCETNVDDCLGNRCSDHGVCEDDIGRYHCRCHKGYTGEFCERRIEFCSSFNPCAAGSTCNNKVDDYTCSCPPGFSGRNCTDNVDNCADNLCQNGGTCVDGASSYSCRCPAGFAGRYCEQGPSVTLMQQTSPCQENECQHGACFLPRDSQEYRCRCEDGYTGKYCEHLTRLSFSSAGGYLALDPPKSAVHSNVTIVLRSRQKNGIVLYRGNRQHLAVELFRGRLRVSYNVGSNPGFTMFSLEVLSDGRPHVVEMLTDGSNFTFRVDGGLSRPIINTAERGALDASEPLYVGGLPLEKATFAVRNWHIRNTTSFRGCVMALYVDDRLIDFQRSREQHKTSPGCGKFKQPRDEQTANVCSSNDCKRGRCVPTAGGKSYRCKCKRGWSGKLCDRAPRCRREQSRDYIRENGCRSRRPVRQARCVGSCGRDCCQPRRVRSRRVSFVCNDGTRYRKVIKVARKCRCRRRKKCAA